MERLDQQFDFLREIDREKEIARQTYLAPVPNRGKRNDSRNLIYIRDRIAEIRGTTPEHVEEFTTRNALRFFGLEE